MFRHNLTNKKIGVPNILLPNKEIGICVWRKRFNGNGILRVNDVLSKIGGKRVIETFSKSGKGIYMYIHNKWGWHQQQWQQQQQQRGGGKVPPPTSMTTAAEATPPPPSQWWQQGSTTTTVTAVGGITTTTTTTTAAMMAVEVALPHHCLSNSTSHIFPFFSYNLLGLYLERLFTLEINYPWALCVEYNSYFLIWPKEHWEHHSRQCQI